MSKFFVLWINNLAVGGIEICLQSSFLTSDSVVYFSF